MAVRNYEDMSNGNTYARLSQAPKRNARPHVSYEQRCNNRLIKVGFHGLWSAIDPPILETPCARIGHFHAYDRENSRVYIGYGLDETETTLDDVWYLDLIKRKWTKIEISGYTPSPRTGASAVFNGRYIFVFGGYNRPNYFSDLHAIDVTTGECTQIETKGIEPSPRTNALMGYYNNKIFIWGGFDRTFPTLLHTLDIDTLEWTEKESGICGRRTAPYTIIDSDLYSYGSSKTTSMLHIDMKNGTIEEIPCTGAAPSCSAQCASMASTKETIFWFGGRVEAEYGFIYAYDIANHWWFVFHARPDGESVNYSDGATDEFGLFQIPLLWSYSMQYEEKTRELVGILGSPMKSPPPLFIVGISEALGVMHLRDDLLSVLRPQYK